MKWLPRLAASTSLVMATGAFAQAAASAPAAFAAASAVMHPSMACAPAMPQKAAEAYAQGTSRIRFHIDETGQVTGAEVIQSAGPSRAHRALDEAAMQALAQCPVVPARDATGRPMASDIDFSYTWKIR